MEYTTIQITTPNQLQQAYAIRFKVFVDEQKFPKEGEIDDIDLTCLHFLLLRKENDEAIGTLRIYKKDETIGRIGRLAILKEARGLGLGMKLMMDVEKNLNQFGITELSLDSQIHAKDFYIKCGYKVVSDEFIREGAPHVLMRKSLDKLIL